VALSTLPCRDAQFLTTTCIGHPGRCQLGKAVVMHAHPILIVEDDPIIQSLLVEALVDEGYQTLTASTGAAGLASMRAQPLACVLLDLNLPGLDGEGVLRCARESGVRVPALLLTADPRGGAVAERVQAPLMAKPFDLDHLLGAVQMLTGETPTAT